MTPLQIRIESCLKTLYQIQYENGSLTNIQIGNGKSIRVDQAIKKVKKRKKQVKNEASRKIKTD